MKRRTYKASKIAFVLIWKVHKLLRSLDLLRNYGHPKRTPSNRNYALHTKTESIRNKSKATRTLAYQPICTQKMGFRTMPLKWLTLRRFLWSHSHFRTVTNSTVIRTRAGAHRQPSLCHSEAMNTRIFVSSWLRSLKASRGMRPR